VLIALRRGELGGLAAILLAAILLAAIVLG
jgi:hypothetical protein